MSQQNIKVTVVKYPDRKFLMMRYVDPYTGKQVGRSTKTTRQREAERVAAKWEAELREGRFVPQSNVSWEAFRVRYEDEVLPGLADKTGEMLQTVFNTVERILRPRKLRDLTADRLSYLQAKLREGGRSEATIRTYMAHLMSALKWAATVGILSMVPKVQRPKRAKKAKVMKGRPITTEEFERMLAKIPSVVGDRAADHWLRFLRGLWLSGLRLSEALGLYWDRGDRLCVDLSGKRPILRIPAELEKGNQDRLLPMAPDFAEFLLAVPEAGRRGRVFRLADCKGNERSLSENWVSRVISRIGEAAGVKVNTDPKTGKIKYASAHDLRRSFGERWARKVMPQILKELMRHESIETTMKYYVGHNAQMTADALWEVYDQKRKAEAEAKEPARGRTRHSAGQDGSG